MRRPARRGFTLIELLIVMSIISFLSLIMFVQVQRYVARSRDGTRKTHLEKYRIVLEEYFTDYGRYPDEAVFQDCGGNGLSPYMARIECDPLSGEPYRYVRGYNGVTYSLWSNLAIENDPVVYLRGCEVGCGPDDDDDGSGDYNYGISSKQVGTGSGGAIEVESPICISGGVRYCVSGQCSSCCPGEQYRCTTDGTGCYQDVSCAQ
jgi:prepilin-type N-terminal cleavage/methylation domain-containing protein